MRVLVLGSGAKDHAVAWWFSQSRFINGLFVAPGNLGTESIAVNLSSVDPSSPEQVYDACVAHSIDFVFVGTESPLFTGVIDYLNERGIATFGAPRKALKLEGDRRFAREFTHRYGIPTPSYYVFEDEKTFADFIERHPGKRFVIKRNALSPSRVMLNSDDPASLLAFARPLLVNDAILVEDYRIGMAVTLSVLMDNKGFLALPACSDYMKTGTGSTGLPTGGMGSICPVPLKDCVRNTIMDSIVLPTLHGLKTEGLAYKGVLTFSLIDTPEDGPILVDYHIRFNDPAAQAGIPLVKSDLVEILQAMQNDTLADFKLEISPQCSVAVVIASEGYPTSPMTGMTVADVPVVVRNNKLASTPRVFCGAVQHIDGKPITTGGRNITVVGVEDTIADANHKAYEIVHLIRFPGAWYRSDIGNKFFQQ
ncbi:phosphoribosylamine--glycine ligase [Parasphaerochaeta coccoides]|uniref:phosphoribosylamine--glycine ligase n=1 Tax=Parasphaerochaeta coccoides (strain ATCC BAA-1237 / DSM 17374 / SPN1) TaxID=760011 RepID=F4GLR1_PARC1|nr:phosphoribosylamine--glycine ligase [Parasphaerochaeta coccoides]AEC02455.1 phosphoribosylamine/glycine ligase [Parasphaerochaeta coccoides DSM 17374]